MLKNKKHNKQNFSVDRKNGDDYRLSNSVLQLKSNISKSVHMKKRSTNSKLNEDKFPNLLNRYDQQPVQNKCLETLSTIQMLKKQAKLLDMDDDDIMPTFTTIDNMLLKEQSCFQQVTKFKKNNVRKVVRGRPEIYNWVRNNQKQKGSKPIIQHKSSSSACKRGTFIERLKKLQEIKFRKRIYNFNRNCTKNISDENSVTMSKRTLTQI